MVDSSFVPNERMYSRETRRRLAAYAPAFRFVCGVILAGILSGSAPKAGYAQSTATTSWLQTQATSLGYRLLYRDALVRRVEVDALPPAVTSLAEFTELLREHTIGVRAEETHGVIFLYDLPIAPTSPPATRSLQGWVSDEESGRGIPFATITWESPDGLRGIATREHGRFVLSLPRDTSITLTIASIGFAENVLRVPTDAGGPTTLSIPLSPITFETGEITILDRLDPSPTDSLAVARLRAVTGMATHPTRTLQPLELLAQTGLTTTRSTLPSIRGSQEDGLGILLDGMPIYAAQHLFGVVDAFNPSVLQTVGLYVNAPPARFSSYAGGVLSLSTRPGNARQVSPSLRIDSQSLSGTIEGPVGALTTMLSYRHSMLNRVGWFNNDDLIRFGLNLGPATVNATRLPRASYADLHGRVDYELSSGAILSAFLYDGRDRSSYGTAGDSLLVPNLSEKPLSPVQEQAIRSEWGNTSIGTRALLPLRHGLAEIHFGRSGFRSTYTKSDMIVFDLPWISRSVTRGFFEQRGDFVHHKLGVDVETRRGGLERLSYGLTINQYATDYHLWSPSRSEQVFNTYQTYLFQSHVDVLGGLGALGQVRLTTHVSHYSVEQDRLRWAPGLEYTLPWGPVTFSAGSARAFQYVHKMALAYEEGPDFWLATQADEQPQATWQHHVSLDFLSRRWPVATSLSVFQKTSANLRLHESSLASGLVDTDQTSTRGYLPDVDQSVQGIEWSANMQLGSLRWHGAVNWTRNTLRSPALVDGLAIEAMWNRPWTLTQQLAWQHADAVIQVNMASGSGYPNPLAYLLFDEPSRMRTYFRMDVSAKKSWYIDQLKIEGQVGFSNLTNRQNEWYRSIRLDERTMDLYAVTMYDLYRHPSFSLSVEIP